MATEEVLRKTLKNADGKPFAKYKNIQNSFVLEDFEIFFDDVQNDRAGHTAMRVRVPMKRAGFPEDTFSNESREIALRDLIARRFWESARTHARSPIPKTDGGELFIPRPGQEILERWSVVITPYFVETRFTADLPSSGGKVSASAMEVLIFERIATVVSESMLYSAYKQSKLYNHIFTAENADAIRDGLADRGLVAFIAEGSILPRREDDLAPMTDASPFTCDDSLRVTFDVPNGDPVSGWGISCGMTALAGCPRSGRSTIADAIAAGVYNHIPGDGREYVVSSPDTAFITSEPGRPSDSVDVSMFLKDSPEFGSASAASSESVCGMHSEYVSMSESIEMGSRFLIMDEEYSSPETFRKGFMDESGSSVPMSDAGPALAHAGISTLLISGDADVVSMADCAVMMDGFHVRRIDVAKRDSSAVFYMPAERRPVSKGMDFEKGRKDVSVTAQSIRTVEIGEFRSSAPVAALYDMSQTRTVADCIAVAKDLMDGSRSMLQVCSEAIDTVTKQDDAKDSTTGMWHSRIRAIDLAAFLNRHPGMLCIQKKRSPAVVAVAVLPVIEYAIGVIVHVDHVLLVVRDDESPDGIFLVAVRTTDVGTVLVRFGAGFASDRPGLEKAEFVAAVGAEVPAGCDLQVLRDACRPLLRREPHGGPGRDGRVVGRTLVGIHGLTALLPP